jgi:Zn-finger nucleic acid-binding protein
MKRCPGCSNDTLKAVSTDHGQFRGCTQCGGMLVTLGLLQKISNPKLLATVWRDARSRGLASGRLCPDCPRSMLHAVIAKADQKTEIDLCEECFLLWFDHSEIDTLPRASDREIEERSAPRAQNLHSPLPIQVDVRVYRSGALFFDHPGANSGILERLIARFI